MEVWLKTDEREESISSLEMVRNASLKVSEDFFQWKWVIIALHNALQGFMVLSLRNGNNFRVMPDKLARKCYEAHRANKPWPKERLDSFLNLYKKIKNDEPEDFPKEVDGELSYEFKDLLGRILRKNL